MAKKKAEVCTTEKAKICVILVIIASICVILMTMARANRDLVKEHVASSTLYFRKYRISAGTVRSTGAPVVRYLAEVARIGEAQIVGILLCLDIRRPKPSRYF